MIYGLGVDLVEIARIRALVEKQPKFVTRILSQGEYEQYEALAHPQRRLEFLAGRFTVKEAFSKALGTGIGKEIAFKDIHCGNDAHGKPWIHFDGFKVHVSITHTEHYAMSQVILEQ
ncbi:4'-phosphopantetheinyl transferase [Staphylococcus microti]|uniref:Holo-[acyl-carrier-protein] synthase n=1 Tax=Staphylococcus microti TaxID=569857 RepID=A0A0D6XT44_9STAP|nr:holo-ACP synthase [Staphylococcus microti]KIX91381.1 4'-phosphopantetheinyl transferase [Staphylococcus microti]PNZ75969.1 holo-ACP synthase [Staphylococcus microti]SUM58019.1 Holo-ACP synthase [Staphylococcus microti]